MTKRLRKARIFILRESDMTRETLKREACSARTITTRASRQQESATERLFGYALSAVGGYAKIDMSRGNVDDAGERGDVRTIIVPLCTQRWVTSSRSSDAAPSASNAGSTV
jgi:hypothetical protein